MCGIIAYIGDKDAIPILIEGLKRLEYRGYDSAGISTVDDDEIQILKCEGKVGDLEKILDDSTVRGSLGIGHTRWATHGVPNDLNAHPHVDSSNKISIIHNGIIENYNILREALEKEGVTFLTETDTEVLVQLIGRVYSYGNLTFIESVQSALKDVIGTYGLAAICSDEPDLIVGARLGSPLVLGIGEKEHFLASDASPIIPYTRNVIYLDDGDIVEIRKGSYQVRRIGDNMVVNKVMEKIEFNLEEIEKGGFDHFMLKEIHDQKYTLTDTMRGRLSLDSGTAHLGGISDYLPRIENASRIYITACGTSWHAALIGKILIEEYARIEVHVDYASEFRYRDPLIDSDSVVIAITQSGETADTLAAVRKAKDNGSLAVGICNVVGSTISRETDCGIYTHAGPEIGVASTKAFTAQVTVLFMLALHLGRNRGMSKGECGRLARAMSDMGEQIEYILSKTDSIFDVAKETVDADNFLYLGRGLNFPVALEGALKLKEISYIHAEGYPAAEMKHGPIALIDEKMPVVFLAPHDKTFEKVLSNIQEVKARKGRIITVTDKKTLELERISDYIIEVPSSHPRTFSIISSVPLQLLAYHLAVLRGCDVDQPRNLAKSVTVE
ncbi:MAG: glutamine--fructose-6-phosphate transaminase (isomerizing) [Candidatus Marinimicrobia bacterium]|nr:glutamine--fructose-6-phosphate transaminase (isomerizing) [Candidatus Neomarinimicrobiota bacterium]|tara:strand:- start:20017 stop:21855 length:1839 start_codon:yes stop_codon:yes gene_type:complete